MPVQLVVLCMLWCARSQICHKLCGRVSRYIHDPGRGHWEAVRWIMRYIKGTADVVLVFEKDVGGKQEYTGFWSLIMLGILTSTGPPQGMPLTCRRHQ